MTSLNDVKTKIMTVQMMLKPNCDSLNCFKKNLIQFGTFK